MRGALSRRAAITSLILMVTVSGCLSTPRTAGPQGTSGSPGTSGQAGHGTYAGLTGLRDVRPCPASPGFSCGTLTVPLDPAGSAAGRLALLVAVADVGSAPRGVLVLLTGGPGQPGVPFVARLAARLGPALNGYRLVMFDQRGTGAGALGCPALQQQMGGSDLAQPTPAAVRECAARLGPDRQFYGTADTVADIEALRAALHAQRLTLDGVSYGSYVAEQYALAHPDRVSRLVLDSVVPAANVDPLQLAGLRWTATVLRAVCAAQHCGFDPARDAASTVARYHDGLPLFNTLVTMSIGYQTFPGVLPALHAAAAGRPARLNALISQVRLASGAPAAELSQGLHASTLCADMRMPWGGPGTPLADREPALARALARLTPSQVWPFDRATAADNGFIQTCLYWPPMRPSPVKAGEVPDVPVLLLAGGRDLSTPLPGARAQAARTPGGHLVILPAAGHSIQNRAAGDAAEPAVAQFLDGG